MVSEVLKGWLAMLISTALAAAIGMSSMASPTRALRSASVASSTVVTPAAAPPSKPHGVYQFLGQVHPDDATNPNIDGALLVFTWSQVEPTKGVFDWSAVEAAIQPWAVAGKKIALRIHTASSVLFNANWNGETAGQATPSWVFAEGVRSVTDPNGSVLPVYWDPAYEHELWATIRAFAARYNGDPRIAWVEAASGYDGESFVEPSSHVGVLARWQAVGYSDAVWQQTVYWTWDVYKRFFTIPVAVEDKGLQISGVNDFRLFADHAVRAGLWVTHNGLSELAYTWNYAAALKNASATTGCALEEKDKLPPTAAGAAQFLTRIRAVRRVGCQIVLIYPAEVQAASAGGPTYQPAWVSALSQAQALLG